MEADFEISSVFAPAAYGFLKFLVPSSREGAPLTPCFIEGMLMLEHKGRWRV